MATTLLENLEVLLVEDSATQALLLKESLESHQLRVKLAKDGQDALEQMRRSPPNVVISDIAMPRVNGFEFCRQVKEDSSLRHVPVILLTGLKDPMDVIKGIACGADSFLTKPCDIHFLLSTMHDVVENKKTSPLRSSGQPLAFFFNGQHHVLQIDHVQITNLLLSTYLNAIQKNQELEESYRKIHSAYEEIKKKNEELSHLNEQKNKFLGMAAHDLRNPLGVIMGYSNLLKVRLAGSADEKSIKMLDKINNSSAFMLRLVDDFLGVSVIESGTISLRFSDVDLTALIQDELILLNIMADKKSLKLKFAGDKVGKVQCDATKITQVLNNLVSNAIKFSTPGGTVDITIHSSSSDVTVTVKDHGIGISPQTQLHLFKPFVKGSSGTAAESSTGLGLAIAQKIVAEHKGKIWFESSTGHGATFSFSIPLKHS